jgi:hypothetical protein
MAAQSVTQSVNLAVGTILSRDFSSSITADADPTDYVIGTQRVGTAGSEEYLTSRAAVGDAIGDIDHTATNVLLVLQNDNALGGGELHVSLANNTTYYIKIKPQQVNVLSVVDLKNVKVVSSSGNCDFTYMAIQIGAD